MAESVMIGDAVTKPLTIEPIHGNMELKMNGSDSADSSERTVSAIIV